MRFSGAISLLLISLTGLRVGLVLVQKGQDLSAQAQTVSQPLGEYWGSRIYSYNFAFKTTPVLSVPPLNRPLGVYDPRFNKTFIVYAGGVQNTQINIGGTSQTVQISQTSPYIVAYDHKKHVWEPSEIRLPGKESENPGVEIYDNVNGSHDSHNSPQVLLDKQGYVHVFWVEHNATTLGILHAVSRQIGSVTSGWNISRINNPDTSRAGYLTAFKSKSGAMYVFFRAVLRNPDGSFHDVGSYEPQWYIKSTDDGRTWRKQMLIDPIESDDWWNAIYVQAYEYVEFPREGVHIAFANSYNHATQFNKHYYFFFNMENDHAYAPDGTDFGVTIDQYEYESHNSFIYDLNFGAGGVSIYDRYAITQDNSGRPIIFYDYCDGMCVPFSPYTVQLVWNGSSWDRQKFLNRNYRSLPLSLEVLYRNQSDIDLIYMVGDTPRFVDDVYYFNFDGRNWNIKQKIIEDDVGHEERWPQLVSYVSDFNPEIIAVYHKFDPTKEMVGSTWPGYSLIGHPRPNGVEGVIGINNFNTPSRCSSFYYSRAISGKPYFIFPKEQPCDNYTLGSIFRVVPSSAEMYSPLIEVEPNTNYTLTYEVRHNGIQGFSATGIGTVVATEYLGTALESDGVDVKVSSSGIRNGIPYIDINNYDWQTKQYSFTTSASSRFVRLRLKTSINGTTRGGVSFRNIKIYKSSSAPQCNSYSDVWIENCTTYPQSISDPSLCRTFTYDVTVFNKVKSAGEVRYINKPMDVLCANVPDSDPGWSSWEPYSSQKAWRLTSGSGDKRVCAQFRNSFGSVKCGGTITYNPSPLSCQSMVNSWINECNSNLLWSSQSKLCTTYFREVSFNNNVSGATHMRLVSLDYSPSVLCSDLRDQDFPQWQKYSDKLITQVTEGFGPKKICAQFKNDTTTVSCGGIINYQSAPPSPTPTPTPTLIPSPPECTSKKDIWLNNCTIDLDLERDPKCLTQNNEVTINYSVKNAQRMRIINVTNSSLCSDVPVSEYQKSSWLPVSQHNKWTLDTAIDGMKKVCVEFENQYGSARCGSVIYYKNYSPLPSPTVSLRDGDANGDGRVDMADYSIWLANYGESTTRGNEVGDFDASGVVDGIDYSIWLQNYSG
jgi:hypothetical protein